MALTFLNMKIHSGDRPRAWGTGTRVWVAFGAAVLILAGCGKKQTAAEPPPPPSTVLNSNTAALPVYTPPAAPTVVAANADGAPDLKQMTHSLRGWIARTHIVPKSFDDFVTQANIQFPPPPAGKKFVIGKRMIVELANQ